MDGKGKRKDEPKRRLAEAKTQEKSKGYKQIKLSTDPQIACAFKAACASANVSMASVLSGFMAEYAKIAKTNVVFHRTLQKPKPRGICTKREEPCPERVSHG